MVILQLASVLFFKKFFKILSFWDAVLLLDTDGELDEKDQMKFSKILGKQTIKK